MDANGSVDVVSTYIRRILDDQLDALFPQLAAIAIEGPKGVGKTATAGRRAATTLALDRPVQQELLAADPGRLERLDGPILLDEWQRYPPSWDLVRRSVDANPAGGRFLLAGSATPPEGATHSGAGRIVRLRLRPLSLAERAIAEPTVSLGELLTSDSPPIVGDSMIDLSQYVDEIVASGFPAIRTLPERARRLQLNGYIARLVDTEFAEQGHRVARPATLRAWLRAYAAATATNASYDKIMEAATPGDADKPAKTTVAAYRNVLERLWLLDPVPGWLPGTIHFNRLAQAPKHHLADPALAARLLGAGPRALLSDSVRDVPAVRGSLLVGALFESLATLCVRVYADNADATVHHLRTRNGDREIDLVVEGQDGRVVAIEVKLAPEVGEADVRHLRWLRSTAPELVADLVVLTTGPHAYRRADGIAVVPLALLGP